MHRCLALNGLALYIVGSAAPYFRCRKETNESRFSTRDRSCTYSWRLEHTPLPIQLSMGEIFEQSAPASTRRTHSFNSAFSLVRSSAIHVFIEASDYRKPNPRFPQLRNHECQRLHRGNFGTEQGHFPLPCRWSSALIPMTRRTCCFFGMITRRNCSNFSSTAMYDR